MGLAFARMAPDSGDAALDTIVDDTTTRARSPPPTAGSRGGAGSATRTRLLECTAELLATTPWRSIKVIDIARQAGTSPATFYQYFENVEQAILVMAEELMQGAGTLAELVDGDWSEDASWATARRVVEGFMAYWEANRAVFRVVELATEEGDLRFQGLRVRALNAVTVTLARVDRVGRARTAARPATDAMAVAATLISMLAHVAAHRYGFEFWGIRTTAMVDTQARVLHWAVTGRPGAAERRRRAPRRAPARWWEAVPPRPASPGPPAPGARGARPDALLDGDGVERRAAPVGERERRGVEQEACTGRRRRSRRRARRASSSGPGSCPSRRGAGGARAGRPRRPRTG